MQELQVSTRFKDDERFLNIGDGRSVLVLALRIIKLVFNSRIIVFNDCHFYPSFLLNVISISLLFKENYEILIKQKFCGIILNGVTVMYR